MTTADNTALAVLTDLRRRYLRDARRMPHIRAACRERARTLKMAITLIRIALVPKPTPPGLPAFTHSAN